MHLSVVGSGYVGTTIAACFANLGHDVVNIDINEDIVATINDGEAPIYEDGLGELLAKHAGSEGTNRLRATTNYADILNTDATFLCLPTPQNENGSINLSIMEDGTEQLGSTLSDKHDWHTVIVKSTVVPGSTEEVITPILEEESGKVAGEDFGVGMNPEFLREGTAVHDFLNPDKVVLGADDDRALTDMHEVFNPLIDKTDAPVTETNTRTAEMIKYANNSFLAAKVSLINDIGNICKEHEVDAYEVADAIGMDSRIGEKFLRSGLGWGGSCFPKDTAAIRASARQHDYEPLMLDAATEINERQPRRLLSLMDDHVDVQGKRVAVLGLAFKPGTDDVRNSRAIPVIDGLKQRGADVVAYDPIAAENMREHFCDIEYAEKPDSALNGASAALIVTDWEEITTLNEEFDAMATPVVIDGRRAISRRVGIVYEGITW